ncbi:MAG: ATP-binding protein [Clostridiales bacterium]|nr:ATP-binding protein [Clostridiales bacterium]
MPVTRRDAKYHGFGMKSVKLILEKHGGSLRMQADAIYSR